MRGEIILRKHRGYLSFAVECVCVDIYPCLAMELKIHLTLCFTEFRVLRHVFYTCGRETQGVAIGEAWTLKLVPRIAIHQHWPFVLKKYDAQKTRETS